jgi:formylglycine-generating enzyme required for sulfatase activity
LRVLALAATTVVPGQRKAIPVRIRRERCAGPVELSLEGLPEGVQAEPAFIRAGADEGQVELTVQPGAARATRSVRVLAVAAGGRDEGEFKLTVEVAELAKEVTNSIGMKLVLIPAGKFTMGSPKDEKDRSEDEGPQHEVEITRPFYLSVHEVTQAEYEKVMGTNPSSFSATGDGKNKVEGQDMSRFPVEEVSWNDAVEFCKKLLPEEKRNERVYRLPTEAEWEYACRGGASLQPFHYGDSLSSTQANFHSNLGRTTRVGSYEANAFGLYDMHGNVWEWCADWYDTNYYKHSPRKDPKGPATGTRRVLRGGSWGYNGGNCRSAYRGNYDPGYRSVGSGFRVVLVAGARTP